MRRGGKPPDGATPTVSDETPTAQPQVGVQAQAQAQAQSPSSVQPGSERLQIRFDPSTYAPKSAAGGSSGGRASAKGGGSGGDAMPSTAAVADLYVLELASALELRRELVAVREVYPDGVATHLLIDLLQDSESGDLGSEPPSALPKKLRALVLSATAPSANRALRSTLEVHRLRPPHGAVEVILSEADATAARRLAQLPAFAAAAAAAAGLLLLCAVALLAHSRRTPTRDRVGYNMAPTAPSAAP